MHDLGKFNGLHPSARQKREEEEEKEEEKPVSRVA